MQTPTLGPLNPGWHAEIPPNGLLARPTQVSGVSNSNPLGIATPAQDDGIETTPEHRNLIAGDPNCLGWTRQPDDPGVTAFRDRLQRENGIKGLEMVRPDEVEKAARLFNRDGFVVVADALSPTQLERMQAATASAVRQLTADDPLCAAGGGAGGMPHRYSFGGGSASRHMMHVQEWCELIDLPTTTPILAEIFGSANYITCGGGGDIAMPGAIEYQGLHSDSMWSELPDPDSRVSMRDLPVPVLTINFPMCDLTPINGPIRQIPGTQRSRAPIPNLADEPDWMKFSTVCPAPAGCAIFRDIRAWHGGTPNLSNEIRAMPNIEYVAPWFRTEAIMRSMPYERWKGLSAHGQRISRHIMVGPDEPVIGAGFMHPKASERDAYREQELAALNSEMREEYLRRL